MTWRWWRRSAPPSCFDNGAFSEWRAALKRGEPWFVHDDWQPYYEWLDARLYHPGRWAVIPDAPGAPSQLNDNLLPQWPFGRSKGAPLWHMDGPLERFLRLAERFDRVCIGWVGQEPVGCPDWFRRMDELAAVIGNQWPVTHMMRGVLVAREYPFASADATSGAQNGWRYDTPSDTAWGDRWAGRRDYLDRLERGAFSRRVCGRVSANRAAARRPCGTSEARPTGDRTAFQPWLFSRDDDLYRPCEAVS